MTHVLQFSPSDLSFSRDGMYDVVTLSDLPQMSLVGKPQLPYVVAHLAIPAGTRVASVEARPMERKTLPGEYLILPAQKPQATSIDAQPAEWINPDETVYSSPNLFPENLVESVRQGILRGSRWPASGSTRSSIHPRPGF